MVNKVALVWCAGLGCISTRTFLGSRCCTSEGGAPVNTSRGGNVSFERLLERPPPRFVDRRFPRGEGGEPWPSLRSCWTCFACNPDLPFFLLRAFVMDVAIQR